MRRARLVAIFLTATMMACHQTQKGEFVRDDQHLEDAVAELRAAYAAFNRGDIDAAVRILDPSVEWIEPAEFPGGGTYHGVDGAKQYLAQSRARDAQVISEPEHFIPAGNRIVVFVHARVLPKGSKTWQDVRLADVYSFQDGRVTNMRAFANRDDALRWAAGAALAK